MDSNGQNDIFDGIKKGRSLYVGDIMGGGNLFVNVSNLINVVVWVTN
jgi:hypothetical protein